MNWLDFVIVVIFAALTVSGFRAGLIREAITFVSVLVGIILASFLYERFAVEVGIFIQNDEAADAVAFLVLVGSAYLAGQIGAYVMKTGASFVMLGGWDHLGGAFFGFLKAFLLVSVLLIILAAYPSLSLDDAVEGSGLAPFFLEDVSFLVDVLPSEISDKVDAFLNPGQASEAAPEPTPSTP